MMSRAKSITRLLAGRLLGDRAVPVGGVAGDRRALRHALATRRVGRVLVVGPGLAARQALLGEDVDVAGTSPHSPEVTVCSAALGAGSLPPDRWDTVIITDPGHRFVERLAAVRPACRPGALLLVLDSAGWSGRSEQAVALSEHTSIQRVVGRGRHRVWVTEVGP